MERAAKEKTNETNGGQAIYDGYQRKRKVDLRK